MSHLVTLAKIQITEALPPRDGTPGVLYVESALSSGEVSAALASVFGNGWSVVQAPRPEEVARKLAADMQDLVDAWRLSDAVRARVEADIAKLSLEEQAVIHRAIQEAGR